MTTIPGFAIAGRPVGPDSAPYLIAEMSANHNGSLERALEIVDAAAKAGADAIKLQTYTADTMTLDVDAPGFIIDDESSLWHGRHLYELYDEAHLPWDWHEPILRRAQERGIACFSSPFDETAVDFLEDLGVPAYKIASFELIDLPLVERVARTGKPMIMSTGASELGEIADAVAAARDAGCKELILLKCTSGYPTPPAESYLKTIPHLAEMLDCVVGLSDHTMGTAVPVAATALGSALVEKHFTLDRGGGGPDDSFSLEPQELRSLCRDSLNAWKALGKVDYGRKASEQGNVQFRRSLYFVTPLSAGEIITADAVRSVRPGFGLAPKHLDEIVGRMDDVFVFDRTDGARILVTPDVMRNAVLDAARDIADFRILREGRDAVAIVLQPALPDASAEAAMVALRQVFAQRHLTPSLSLRRETLSFEPHRKLRRVECRFRPEAEP